MSNDTVFNHNVNLPTRSLINFYFDNFGSDLTAPLFDLYYYYVGLKLIATIRIDYATTAKEKPISGTRTMA